MTDDVLISKNNLLDAILERFLYLTKRTHEVIVANPGSELAQHKAAGRVFELDTIQQIIKNFPDKLPHYCSPLEGKELVNFESGWDDEKEGDINDFKTLLNRVNESIGRTNQLLQQAVEAALPKDSNEQ